MGTTSDDSDFRLRCRAFLDEHATGDACVALNQDPRGDAALAVARSFQAKLFAAGLAGLSLPVAFGGQGLDPKFEHVWREEASCYPLMTEELSISLGNCLPVISEFGTPRQKQRHIAAALSGEHVFCQMFSEPEAGSDAAGLKTKAVPDGDGYVLNGNKRYITNANVADLFTVMARTDQDVAGAKGVSAFIRRLSTKSG